MLETWVAVARGVDWLERHAKAPSNLKGEKLLALHRFLYRDAATTPLKAMAVKEIAALFASLVMDHNGFIRSLNPHQLAAIYARIYRSWLEIAPFTKGNALTLRLWFAGLTPYLLPSYTLDFRRLKSRELYYLKLGFELESVFLNALDARRAPIVPDSKQAWPAWPESTIRIGGVQFLKLVDSSGIYLLTTQGKPIALEKIQVPLLAHMAMGGSWQAFPLAQFHTNFSERETLVSVEEIVEASIDTPVREAFKNAQPSNEPWLIMTLGGAGSGKSLLRGVAKELCGEDLVIASLDDARIYSPTYQLLQRAGHHSDDYVAVEHFANAIRSGIIEQAFAGRYHLMIDGSGSPYAERWQHIIRRFKKAGYRTAVLAVDAPLPIAASRIIRRFSGSDRRGVPWDITVEKHIQLPVSFLQAADDKALDHLVLLKNEGKPEDAMVIAERADGHLKIYDVPAMGQVLAKTAMNIRAGGPDVLPLQDHRTGFFIPSLDLN